MIKVALKKTEKPASAGAVIAEARKDLASIPANGRYRQIYTALLGVVESCLGPDPRWPEAGAPLIGHEVRIRLIDRLANSAATLEEAEKIYSVQMDDQELIRNIARRTIESVGLGGSLPKSGDPGRAHSGVDLARAQGPKRSSLT